MTVTLSYIKVVEVVSFTSTDSMDIHDMIWCYFQIERDETMIMITELKIVSFFGEIIDYEREITFSNISILE